MRLTRPLRMLLAPALVAASVAACDSEEGTTPEPEAPETLTSLSATLGPEGGRVEGPAGTVFEGVVVEVPAGALNAEIELTLSPSADRTPLPPRAFAVGPQFTLGPQGLSVSAPLVVTLPTNQQSVALNGQDAVSVKVWLKGPQDSEWTLATNVGDPSGGSVSFEMEGAGAAAAGVKMPATQDVEPPCPSCLDAPCEGQLTCATSGKSVAPEPTVDRLASDGTRVYWLSDTQEGSQVTVWAHRAVPGESSEVSAPLTWGAANLTDLGVARGFVVVDDVAWVAVQQGVLRLDFGGGESAPRVIQEGQHATTVVRTIGGSLVSISLGPLGLSAHLPDTGAQLALSMADVDIAPSEDPHAAFLHATHDPSTPDVFWLVASTDVRRVHKLRVEDSAITPVGAPIPLQADALGPAVGLPDGGAAFIVYDPLDVAVLSADGAVSQLSLTGAMALANGSEGLWVALSNYPQAFLVDSAGDALRVPLALDEGDPLAFESIPRAIVSLANGRAVLLDQARKIRVIETP